MFKNLCVLSFASLFAFGCASTSSNSKCEKNYVSNTGAEYDVCAIIWPAYQPEPRWKELGIFPDGKGEWQNVYEAKPKVKDHNQPIVPLWGYEFDDDPIAVARKIDAALAAGINVFMYDWYWYNGKPFLENALNEGFLKAPNNERMKFYLMWANHTVTNLWNNKADKNEKGKVLWRAEVSYDEFTKVLVPRFINYFKKPNYYKINNKPVFSLYQLHILVRGMGDIQTAKKAFDYLDAEAKKAGFAGVHYVWNNPVKLSWLGGDTIKLPNNPKPTAREIIEYMDFDSHTTYNWVGETWNAFFNAKPEMTYAEFAKISVGKWDKIKETYKGQYFPQVSLAWDTNPRFVEYQPKVQPAKPEDFEWALRQAKKWIDENRQEGMPKLITINAWNEWTEGCYLEPDKKNGYGYLNAVSRVFGGNGQACDKK